MTNLRSLEGPWIDEVRTGDYRRWLETNYENRAAR
jgi:hypothetical protein